MRTVQDTERETFELGYAAHKAGCWLRLLDIVDEYTPQMRSENPAQKQTATAIIIALHTLHKAGLLRRVIEGDESP